MKPIILLRNLISIYYYLMLIAFAFGLILLPILLFTGSSYELTIFDQQFTLNDLGIVKGLIAIVVIGAFLYVYFRMIQLIKRTVSQLSRGQYFTSLIINNFNAIGKLLLICAVGSSILKMVLSTLLTGRIHLEIDLNSNVFLFLIMGLFFLFLSEVFLKAKEHKEENDLTV